MQCSWLFIYRLEDRFAQLPFAHAEIAVAVVVDADRDLPQEVEELEPAVGQDGNIDDVDGRFRCSGMERLGCGFDDADPLHFPFPDAS